jgi:hypothetical protein
LIINRKTLQKQKSSKKQANNAKEQAMSYRRSLENENHWQGHNHR